MAITTVSSREFNQDVSGVKRAAAKGPVFITDRGRTSYVLLSIQEYQRITQTGKSLADLLAMPGSEDIELEIPQRRQLARGADFS
jgi:prevent-host-death family protein